MYRCHRTALPACTFWQGTPKPVLLLISNKLVSDLPRPARFRLQEAIQKEKARSIKLVAQEKGWLMDKAANYHAAFMSVCGPPLHVRHFPTIHVRVSRAILASLFAQPRNMRRAGTSQACLADWRLIGACDLMSCPIPRLQRKTLPC